LIDWTMQNLPDLGKLDGGVKWVLSIAGTMGVASAITLPTTKQSEKAALELFDKPLGRLTPQERKTAEFQAGYGRWKGFFETTVYPLTRKLPGANNPILNPYRGMETISPQENDDE
jgi:hypothetical protein